jgi:hypothetical protein
MEQVPQGKRTLSILMCELELNITHKRIHSLDAQTCELDWAPWFMPVNPSYLGGRDRQDCGSKPAHEKSS